MRIPEERQYVRDQCVVFRKTNEEFGGLSNMAAGYVMRVNGVLVGTSEALYQCCRFPDQSDVQKLILAERSPMTAKMKSKPFRRLSRPDWDEVRVPIMRWCIRLKLYQNLSRFGILLSSTGGKMIVEESRRDGFWGAKPIDTQTLVGQNVLGRLLTELRERYVANRTITAPSIVPPSITGLLFLGKPIDYQSLMVGIPKGGGLDLVM